MSCSMPISDEKLVAYWADDLGDADTAAVEEHLFACDACLATATRVQQIAQVFRSGLPPVISHEQLAALHAQGLTIVETTFAADRPQTVTFEPTVDLLIHRLGGLDLADAERVEVTVRSGTGMTMFEEPIAPFDPARGEVLIACQRHFGRFEQPDVVFDVRVHRPAAPPELRSYFVPHIFVP